MFRPFALITPVRTGLAALVLLPGLALAQAPTAPVRQVGALLAPPCQLGPCPSPECAPPRCPELPPPAPSKEPEKKEPPEKKEFPKKEEPTPEVTPPATEPSLSPETSAAVGGGEGFAMAAPGGYLDNAIPMTMFRLRYDAAFHMNRFDRADFLFGTWKELSFHPHGVQGDGAFLDPHARGPLQLSRNIDYQEASAYFEYAVQNRFSAFVNLPYRYVDFGRLQEDFPESEQKANGILPANIRNLTGAARARAILGANPNPGLPFFPEPERGQEGPHTKADSFSDMDFGIKFAVVKDEDRYLTFQFRTYSPTGDSELGIGNGHWTVEPGLLYYQRMDRVELQGQLQYWQPLTDDPAAAPIVVYGVGIGYDVYKTCKLRIVPITEWMGWTVLGGTQSFFGNVVATPPDNLILPHTHGVESAAGETIVNAKIGVRAYFGDHSDLYAGYGRAITGPRWYQDIFRVEYRYKF